MEVEAADWGGLERVGLDLSLMVLRSLNLAGARLDGLVAMGTVFDRCNLDDAVLRGATIREWTGDPIAPGDDPMAAYPTLSDDATLDPGEFDIHESADGWGYFIRKAAIHACTMRRADLSRATLAGLHVFGSALDGSLLVGADLRGAHLESVTMVGVDLTGADLGGARLEDVDLTGATLPPKATLEACRMERVRGI